MRGIHRPVSIAAELAACRGRRAPSVGGINDLNQVVGWQLPGGGQPYKGYFWSMETGRVDIQIEGWMATRCTDINDDGVMCGNVSQTSQAAPSSAGVRAFVLDAGAVTIIEPPAPFTMSEARRINNSGVVGGNLTTSSAGGAQEQSSGMLYEPSGRVTLLPPPPGYLLFSLQDLNESLGATGTLLISSNVRAT